MISLLAVLISYGQGNIGRDLEYAHASKSELGLNNIKAFNSFIHGSYDGKILEFFKNSIHIFQWQLFTVEFF